MDMRSAPDSRHEEALDIERVGEVGDVLGPGLEAAPGVGVRLPIAGPVHAHSEGIQLLQQLCARGAGLPPVSASLHLNAAHQVQNKSKAGRQEARLQTCVCSLILCCARLVCRVTCRT